LKEAAHVDSLQPTGDVLDQLERANLFLVPLDNTRRWYRYHHLFADLLRQRLREILPPAEIAHLHRCASEWCEAHADLQVM
jgi:LuxR family maltose regulon positive regulatory protein